MIEKLSKKEIEQLIKELSEQGYDIKERDKSKIMKQEAKNALNCEEPFICQDISNAIYLIADHLTDNYEKAGKITRKKKTVSAEIMEDYRSIIRRLLIALAPFFGRIGFCDRKGNYVR